MARPRLPADVLGIFVKAPQVGKVKTRLAAAYARHFAEGAARIVVIGSDCPRTGLPLVCQAFQALDHDDLVIGPAPGTVWSHHVVHRCGVPANHGERRRPGIAHRRAPRAPRCGHGRGRPGAGPAAVRVVDEQTEGYTDRRAAVEVVVLSRRSGQQKAGGLKRSPQLLCRCTGTDTKNWSGAIGDPR